VLPSASRIGTTESSEKAVPSALEVRGANDASSPRTSAALFPSAEEISRERTVATSFGRMAPTPKSTVVSHRYSPSESLLSVTTCRLSAGFFGAGTLGCADNM
jgi:hypothetical protein